LVLLLLLQPAMPNINMAPAVDRARIRFVLFIVLSYYRSSYADR